MNLRRISLSKLLSLVAFCALFTTVYVQYGAVSRVRAKYDNERKALLEKIDQLERELGVLQVEDRSRAYVVRVDDSYSRQRRHRYRFRVYLPEFPGTDLRGYYVARAILADDLEVKESPYHEHVTETLKRVSAAGGVEIGVQPGERTVDIDLFETDSGELRIDLQSLPSSREDDWYAGTRAAANDDFGPYSDSFLAEGDSFRVDGPSHVTKERNPCYPILLLRSSSLVTDRGVLVYIEPRLHGRSPGEETANALIAAMESEKD